VYKSRIARKLARRIVRWIGLSFIFGINILLLLRVFSSGDPAEMKSLAADPLTVRAYGEAGEELPVYYQTFEPTTSTTGQYSYFTLTRALFLPTVTEDGVAGGQVQVVLRYSNAMLGWLAEDYGLAELPAREDDLFDLTLLVEREDGEGNVTAERYFPEQGTDAATKNRYNYRRFVFNGVDCFADGDFDGSVRRVTACIYYNEDVDYESDAYGSLSIYQRGYNVREYDLARKDRKALNAAG
jgi:hypothetical protein